MTMVYSKQITKSIFALFTIFLTCSTLIIFHSCSFLPEKNDFFTRKDYRNLGSIDSFDPIPIFNKLDKYNTETANENILNAMEYSLNMIKAGYDVAAGKNSTFLLAFIRLFWLRVLLNKDNIIIKSELEIMRNFDNDWFIVKISSALLTNFYTGEYFKTPNSFKSFYIFENGLTQVHKAYKNFDYNKIAEDLAKEFVKECPNIIPPYYYLIHIYAHSKNCSEVKRNFKEIEKYLSPNNEESKLYAESGYYDSIKTYTKDFKEYISQFCDMEDLKN